VRDFKILKSKNEMIFQKLFFEKRAIDGRIGAIKILPRNGQFYCSRLHKDAKVVK